MAILSAIIVFAMIKFLPAGSCQRQQDAAFAGSRELDGAIGEAVGDSKRRHERPRGWLRPGD